MKVYRIYHKRLNQFIGSRVNNTGIYLSLDSAKRDLNQYKHIKSSLVIKEYELINEIEITG